MRGTVVVAVAKDSILNERLMYNLHQAKSPDPLVLISIDSSSGSPGEVTVNGGTQGPNKAVGLRELEASLPITESRNGTMYSAIFHILCSGIGFQALLLPVAFATLGWGWSILCLLLAYTWKLYSTWLLVHLHETVPGTCHSHYLRLSIAAFDERICCELLRHNRGDDLPEAYVAFGRHEFLNTTLVVLKS
ncbi:hypothetical protein SLEP1_g56011 [Rubroshorea leprosula]|uniref:Amino acid transporter transmembrane domain-containing protein n=1 Tax=Rubroshorea leprosula TaxID=152421 RepID=A0AAV5MHJ2_9ROSI|nr:hypothetical protein SLEP1_g56011 [Rubroshorea leprosula]